MASVSFVALRCLGGAGAPTDMVRDLRRLEELPPGGRAAIWSVVGPALNERPPRDMDRRIASYAQRHDIPAADVVAMVRAYRLLLRSAFSVGASPEDLAVDLDAIASDGQKGELIRVAILPGFPTAHALLQEEATGGAVQDHGSVLTGVDWRLDRLIASTRGDADGAFVGMLTLHCSEGTQSSRVTLQALPDAIVQLREACDRMLRAAERQAARDASKQT